MSMSTTAESLSTLQKAAKALLSILERAEKQEATAEEIRILPSIVSALCNVVNRISNFN